jgi:hypothetical protein
MVTPLSIEMFVAFTGALPLTPRHSTDEAFASQMKTTAKAVIRLAHHDVRASRRLAPFGVTFLASRSEFRAHTIPRTTPEAAPHRISPSQDDRAGLRVRPSLPARAG